MDTSQEISGLRSTIRDRDATITRMAKDIESLKKENSRQSVIIDSLIKSIEVMAK